MIQVKEHYRYFGANKILKNKPITEGIYKDAIEAKSFLGLRYFKIPVPLCAPYIIGKYSSTGISFCKGFSSSKILAAFPRII